MKILLFVLFFVSGSFAQAGRLFDYIAYSKAGITAECSDFLGKVASDGPVELVDFLIQSNDQNSCALSSASQITLTRGGIEANDRTLSCVESPQVAGSGTFSRHVLNNTSQYDYLYQEMDRASTLLAHKTSGNDVVVMKLNGDSLQYAAQTTITLSATKGKTLVVNVSGRCVSIEGVGIALVGGVAPQNIVWNFYEAETLTIRHSGADRAVYGNIGMPGTFIAPKATVYFNDALITGALYAKKIIGKAENPGTCSGSVSGQINPACLVRGSLGIGCGPGSDLPNPCQGNPHQCDHRQGNQHQQQSL